MPNHCTNTVHVVGTAATLVETEELLRGETAFDFEKIRPMPEELASIKSGSTIIDGVRYDRWRVRPGPDGQPVSVPVSDAELADLQQRHGARDWYEWALAHWGTKWNAYQVKGPERVRYRGQRALCLRYVFDTAWGPPRPLLEALVERLPVRVTLKYAIEGGQGSGFEEYEAAPQDPRKKWQLA